MTYLQTINALSAAPAAQEALHAYLSYRGPGTTLNRHDNGQPRTVNSSDPDIRKASADLLNTATRVCQTLIDAFQPAGITLQAVITIKQRGSLSGPHGDNWNNLTVATVTYTLRDDSKTPSEITHTLPD